MHLFGDLLETSSDFRTGIWTSSHPSLLKVCSAPFGIYQVVVRYRQVLHNTGGVHSLSFSWCNFKLSPFRVNMLNLIMIMNGSTGRIQFNFFCDIFVQEHPRKLCHGITFTLTRAWLRHRTPSEWLMSANISRIAGTQQCDWILVRVSNMFSCWRLITWALYAPMGCSCQDFVAWVCPQSSKCSPLMWVALVIWIDPYVWTSYSLLILRHLNNILLDFFVWIVP